MAVEEDLGYIQPVNETVLLMQSDCTAASQMLEAGNASIALQPRCFVQHRSDVFVLGDYGVDNLFFIAISSRRKGENRYIPDEVKAIRELVEMLIRHYSLQLFS